MGFREFVVVIASIMALNPLAMDMMLPALPDIGSAFHIAVAYRPQMVLSTFLIGFGVGQFVMGPLSDRFGRRPVLLGGMAVYCVASLLAIAAPSFETLLLARALQGLCTSATRVIATSIVRDCYAGRRMASVMSLAMMLFIAVPVVAPSVGEVVLLLTQWRGLFVVLMVYGGIGLRWRALLGRVSVHVAEGRACACRLRRCCADHAAVGEDAQAAAAAVHGPVGSDDVLVRGDVRQFHVACDGATGPYRRHGFVVVRVDHDAAWHWHRHHDRPRLRRHAFAVCERVFPLHVGFPGSRACGGKGPAVQAAQDAGVA